LSDASYRHRQLQALDEFVLQTVSWIAGQPTFGETLFCDWQSDQMFVYQNGRSPITLHEVFASAWEWSVKMAEAFVKKSQSNALFQLVFNR
jgi:hypothetical protein